MIDTTISDRLVLYLYLNFLRACLRSNFLLIDRKSVV